MKKSDTDSAVSQIEPRSNVRHLAKGVGLILFAWLCLVVMTTITRFAIPQSSLGMVLFFQNGISFLLMLPWFFHYGLEEVKSSRVGLIIVRSVCGLLGFTCMFVSAEKISLTGAVLLNNAAPLYVPFVLWFWRKKRVEKKLWMGIVLGFVGVVFMLRPWEMVQVNFVDFKVGSLFGFSAGVFLAITLVAMRMLLHTEKVFTVLLYYFFIASLITLPFAWMSWVPLTWDLFWMFLAIGGLSYLGQYALLKAFYFGKASQLSPFVYMAVVYSGLIDWLYFHHLPGLFVLVGIACICAGGIFTLLFSHPAESASPK